MVDRSGYAASSFLLGAVFGFIAGLGNSRFLFFLAPVIVEYSEETAVLVAGVIVAPIIEEISKVLPLVFLESQECITLTITQWLKLGVASALGFSTFENLYYSLIVYARFGLHQFMSLMVIRFLTCTPVHVASTALSSYGIGCWNTYRMRRYFAFVAAAMLNHGLYNLAAILLNVVGGGLNV